MRTVSDSNVLKIMSWNCEGLKNKVKSSDFINYVKEFCIIGLIETWCERGMNFQLPGYLCFSQNVEKRNRTGRVSGGISVFVKEHFHANKLDGECQEVLWVKIELGGNLKIIFGEIYNPPESSNYFNRYFFDQISNDIIKWKQTYHDFD